MCEVLRGIQINQCRDLWHFCVKIPGGEHKSSGLWDMVMFTFRVHTQTSSSALVALRNTGYANYLLPHSLTPTHPHTHTLSHACTRTHRLSLFLFCSQKLKPENTLTISKPCMLVCSPCHCFLAFQVYIIYIFHKRN